MRRSLLFRSGLICFGSFAALLFLSKSAVAETKTYAISWFTQATSTQDGDCPHGLVPLPEDAFRRDLQAIDMQAADVERIMKGYLGGSSTPETIEALVNRGRVDGKPVNAYTYPMAVPDPHFSTVVSRFAYGFNLDGKGAGSPNSFEDPETHERGVNNQYWRAMGCHLHHRGSTADLPAYWSLTWGSLRDSMPAWLISIEAADLSKDGDVTVTFEKALEHVSRDANGDVRADSTFRVDADRRWHNVLHGKIRDGVVTVESGDVHLAGDAYILYQLEMRQTHLRMKLNPDGSAQGILGGYVPWRIIYFIYAGSGYTAEGMIGVDVPGIYHSLKELADAYPDEKTGQNMWISSAFKFQSVPAFIAPGVQDKVGTR